MPIIQEDTRLGQLSETTDAELVRRVQQNLPTSAESREAIGVLYDRHNERVFRYLWVRLSDRQHAEDLTGEVFARMVAALPGYQDRKLPFQAWLYRIARNLLIDLYRKESAGKLVPLEAVKDLPIEDHNPAPTVEHRMQVEEVQRALEQLKDQYKDVIVLRFIIGLPIKEVALILDKTVPTIKGLQHRGLRDLRLSLDHP